MYDTFEYRVHASHTVGMKKRRKSEQGDRREKEEEKRSRKLEADPIGFNGTPSRISCWALPEPTAVAGTFGSVDEF